jgi:type I restriction enzyme, S subunit
MSSEGVLTGEEDQARMLVPKLRFPEFLGEEEWNVEAIGNIFTVTRGNVLAMPLVADVQSVKKPYPVFSSQTKNNGLAGYYSEFLYENAITWTTDGANAGDVNYRQGKFYCTNVCGVLVSQKGYANGCVAAIIDSVSRNYVCRYPQSPNNKKSPIASPRLIG